MVELKTSLESIQLFYLHTLSLCVTSLNMFLLPDYTLLILNEWVQIVILSIVKWNLPLDVSAFCTYVDIVCDLCFRWTSRTQTSPGCFWLLVFPTRCIRGWALEAALVLVHQPCRELTITRYRYTMISLHTFYLKYPVFFVADILRMFFLFLPWVTLFLTRYFWTNS